MAGFSELAVATIRSSQRETELIANNVANINTPGYRSKRIFQRILSDRVALPESDFVISDPSTSAAMRMTSRPLDLAIAGNAWLLLRDGDRFTPVKSVQLHLDRDQRLVDDQGRVLQAAGGGDMVVSASNPQILRDGILLVDGQPEGRVGLFAVEPSELIGNMLPDARALVPAEDAVLHQGMITTSDVDLSSEMVGLTKASRMAETGARMFKMYDELLSSAASRLGNLK